MNGPHDEVVPLVVKRAVALMLLNVLLEAAAVVVVLATRAQVKRDLLADQPKLSPSTVDTTLTIAGFTNIVILLLLLLLAFRVRAGANWARVTTWIVAGFGATGLLLTFTETTSTTNHTFSIVTGLIDLAIIALLATRVSNRYFRHVR